MRKRTVIGTIVAVAATTIAAYICHQVRQLEPRGFKSISVAFNKMLVLHRNHDVTVLEFTSYDDRDSQRFLNFGIQKAGPLSFRWRQRQQSGQERQGKGSVSETALVK